MALSTLLRLFRAPHAIEIASDTKFCRHASGGCTFSTFDAADFLDLVGSILDKETDPPQSEKDYASDLIDAFTVYAERDSAFRDKLKCVQAAVQRACIDRSIPEPDPVSAWLIAKAVLATYYVRGAYDAGLLVKG